MALTYKPLVQTKYAENTLTVQYTVLNPVRMAVIHAFSGQNNSGGIVTFDIYIVPPNSVPYKFTTVVLAPKESFIIPTTIGQALQVGYTIQTNCSQANAVLFQISGTEQT
jgi:hypothetical protein